MNVKMILVSLLLMMIAHLDLLILISDMPIFVKITQISGLMSIMMDGRKQFSFPLPLMETSEFDGLELLSIKLWWIQADKQRPVPPDISLFQKIIWLNSLVLSLIAIFSAMRTEKWWDPSWFSQVIVVKLAHGPKDILASTTKSEI